MQRMFELTITARWYGQKAVAAQSRPVTCPGALAGICPGGQDAMARYLQSWCNLRKLRVRRGTILITCLICQGSVI